MTEADERLITQLRDCFNAGYQFPQYCIDNNIKKPLFVGIDESQKYFLWEIYVQFKYTNIPIQVSFTLCNSAPDYKITYSHHSIIAPLSFATFSEIDFNNFDKIIVLTVNKEIIKENDKVIRLNQICNYFFNRTYCDIPLLHFSQKYPKTKIIVTNFPSLPKIDLEFNKKLTSSTELRRRMREDRNLNTLMDKLGYSKEEIFRLHGSPRRIVNLDGTSSLPDDAFYHIKQGKRETAYQPKNYNNKIHFVGGCHQFGICTPFEKTIESYLQRKLNDNNLPYCVENESQFYGNSNQNLLYNLNSLDPKAGDIIFVWLENLKPQNIPFLDLSHSFDSYDYREIFVSTVHINEIGYKILAEKYFDYLVENNFFKYTNFEYPPPQLYLIVMVFRKKISQAQQNFWTTKTWTITKQSCVTNDLKSAA